MFAAMAVGPPETPRRRAYGLRRDQGQSARRADGMTEEDLCHLLGRIGSHRDRAAFAELFQYFAPRLKAYGMRRGTPPEAAEELAQEAMISVWNKANTYDRRKAAPSTWVFTIVRNKRIDMLRRENRPELDPDDPALSGPPVESGLDRYEVVETQEALRKSISTLPPEQAQAIQKAYFEDKSHRVIADELGLPLGTVKSRIRLAVAALRSVMPEQDQ